MIVVIEGTGIGSVYPCTPGGPAERCRGPDGPVDEGESVTALTTEQALAYVDEVRWEYTKTRPSWRTSERDPLSGRR